MVYLHHYTLTKTISHNVAPRADRISAKAVNPARKDAKSHAFAPMNGIRATGLMQVRDGVFSLGKLGAFFAVPFYARKPAFYLPVRAANGRARTI